MIDTIRKHGPYLCVLLLYFGMVSIVLRYPTSTNLTLIPLDPNFPLHALAGLDLSDGGTGFVNTRLEFPDGAPIRYLAWPLLLCSQLFEGSYSPITAFHMGIIVWLTLQGVLLMHVFEYLLKNRFRSLVASTLALCTPQTLIALGNSQFENVAPAFLLVIAWAIERKKFKWLFFGLLGACFSSPYMGFLGLLLALIIGYRSVHVWMSMTLSGLASWTYYTAVTSGEVHQSTQPAPSTMSESANLLGIVLPINIAENGGTSLPSILERIRLLITPIPSEPFDGTWFWVMVTASSFLGISWVVLGVIGLWNKRKHPLIRKLMLWAGLALLCSFGNELSIDSGTETSSIPWFWMLTDFIPGLADMNATHRFLMAPGLVLAIGVACIVNRNILRVGFAVCTFEALLISPAHWPIPTKKAIIPDELSVIQKPFIFWPPPPVISSYKVTMTGLLINQPIALFSAQGSSMPDASGKTTPIHSKLDRHGRTLQEWTQLVQQADVNNLIQYRSFHEKNGRLPIRTHQRMCHPSYCVSMLMNKIPE